MGRLRHASLLIVTLLGFVWLFLGRGVGGQIAATTNLIVNGGFESGTSPWAGTFSLVTEAGLVHSGARAARVNNASAWQAVAVQGGARYQLTAWAIKNAPAISYVRLKVEWRNAGGDLLRTNISDLNTDDPSYRLISLGPVAAPDEAVRAVVYVQSIGTGNSYFDDISMVMTAPPPATATATLTPTYLPTATRTPSPSPTATRRPSPSPTATPTPLPAGMLTLNEILFHPAPNAEPGTLEARREWVELYNAGTVPIALEGYTLEDGEDMDPLPAVALPSGGFLILTGDENAFLADYPLFAGDVWEMADGALGNGLSNAGDALILRDGMRRVVDAMSYGEDVSIFETPCPTVPAGHSLEREPAGRDTDGAGDFVERETPSPGGTPLPTPTPTYTPTSTSTATPTLTATPSATPAAPTSTPTPPMWGVRLPLLLR